MTERPDASTHDRLPLYVAGALDEVEAREFARHLDACEKCRREQGVLERLRDQFSEHGKALIEDHPPVEQLIEAAAGKLEGEAREAVERHVAICAACANETRWILEEAIPDGAEARRAAPRAERVWPRRAWLAAAAMAAGLAVGLALPPLSPSRSQPRFVVQQSVAAPRRADSDVTVVRPRPGAQTLQLIFAVDFPPAAYPLEFELNKAQGERLWRSEVAPEDVLEGVDLVLELPLRLCPPGRYSVTLRSADRTGAPRVIDFEVAD